MSGGVASDRDDPTRTATGDAPPGQEPPHDVRSGHRWYDSRLLALCLGSLVVVVASGIVQVRYGSFEMTLEETVRAVFDPTVVLSEQAWRAMLFGEAVPWLGAEFPEVDRRTLIVWNIRMPRVFVGVLVGMALAISGAIFQAVTRNELASPFVLGVSSGAGLAILLTLVVFSSLSTFLPIFAALGGTLAFLLVYAIAWKNGSTSPVRLVLAGVVVNMVFRSLQRGLLYFADDLGVVRSALSWTTGSLISTDWGHFRLVVIPIGIAIVLAIAGARQLNVLLLGSETARSLGMRVERMRFLLAGVAILAASASVAVAGLISFFGLVVPHVVRLVVGSDYRRLIVGCLFAGPALMVAADVGARLFFLALQGDPRQVPVGIVTGVIGGPYFLYLLRRTEKMGEI